ncbi:hypothetical protein BU23DRAFT_572343 [Bimuria novae-zelandiae CBS 107.79]|uniref:Mediator of RNA polymerase II transcription subunit 22 n=1 Tax=Bimuria novae-zelandiae CBS 107.79 TaxID=1447943 RepID=A0A6A5UTY7_9PLEO|nr:hypothetical protein BU23DRAFT_572343 [Bimuria novae-zelandiae CBS 107.79]
MDTKSRNAAALHKRINDLISDFTNQYRALLAIAREDDDPDFSQSAQKELAIKEGALAIVTAAQNTTVLVRDLQELWLFGGLDTLKGPRDVEGEREKVAEVAGAVETLVKGRGDGGV